MQVTMISGQLSAGHYIASLQVQGMEDFTPTVEVLHLGQPVGTVEMSEIADGVQMWRLDFTVPPDLLSDGVQTFLIRENQLDQDLGSFVIVAGEPLDQDLRAEIGLLRAEVDLLKRAFRRQMSEHAG